MKYYTDFLTIGCLLALCSSPVFSQTDVFIISKGEYGLHLNGGNKIILEEGEYVKSKEERLIIFYEVDTIDSFDFDLLDKNGLSFKCTLNLTYSITKDQLLALANKLGDKVDLFKDIYIVPIIRSQVRFAFGHYEYSQAANNIDQINTEIRQELENKFEDYLQIQSLTLKYSEN